MKATGIVRRIDDLGRVVIPKEIRRTLAIREGDPLEIYTTDGGVLFRKYDSIDEAVRIVIANGLEKEAHGKVIDEKWKNWNEKTN